MAYYEADTFGHAVGTGRPVAEMCASKETSFEHFGAKQAHYDTHAVIYYEGDPAKRLYELASGTVMLYKLLPDGRRQVVEVLAPGRSVWTVWS